MRIMAELLQRDRAPAEVMLVLAAEEAQMQKHSPKRDAMSHVPVAVVAHSSTVTGDKSCSEA